MRMQVADKQTKTENEMQIECSLLEARVHYDPQIYASSRVVQGQIVDVVDLKCQQPSFAV